MYVTRANLAAVLDLLEKEHEWGLDTETTGFRETDRLFALIIAIKENAFYFNFQDYGSDLYPALDREFTLALIRELTKRPRTYYIQNAKFDMRMLAREDIFLGGNIHCTYAVERLVKNNYFGGDGYRLKGLAARRGWQKDDQVDAYITKNKLITKVKIPGKKKIGEFKHFDRVPPEIIVPYGTQDARLHYDIAKHQLAELERDNHTSDKYPTRHRVLGNEIRLTETLFRMERRGIKIDRRYTANALAFEQGKIEEARKEFLDLTGREFADSRKLLSEVFTAAGESFPTTALGNASFAAEVLEEMSTPIAGVVNRIRGLDKKVGTYYSSFLHLATPDDTIHADAQQAGTETGRMSYRDPNLQNVPKEDEAPDIDYPYLVRGCFVPREGYVFHSIDYKTMEYATLMDQAGETRVIERMQAGEDFHQVIADLVGTTRKRAKTLNFMLGYGGGADKLAAMLGISKREAQDLIADYWGGIPRVAKMMAAIRDSAKARGWIFNPYGRRSHLEDPQMAYIMPNHFNQGLCADVVKFAMNSIDSMLLGLKAESALLIQVHDEFLIESKIGEEDLIPRIQDLMSRAYVPKNGLNLGTSVEWSDKSWSAKDKVKGIYAS